MFRRFLKKDLGEKVHFILINLVRLSLIVSLVLGIYNLRWLIIFVSLIVFIFTFAPYLFEKRYKIDLPIEFEILSVLFIYASLFLGELHGFYTKVFWWDVLLHAGSAIAFGFVGFAVLYIMDKSTRIKASPATLALFSFCFAMAIGGVWEIFEFAMDSFFGFNMQKSGLVDTMGDLIADAIGALVASFSGYLYLKGNEKFIFSRIIKRFEKSNKRLFRR